LSRPGVAGGTAALVIAGQIGLSPAAAAAAGRRSLCTDRVAVRDSPAGFVIGRLVWPQRLLLLHETADGWAFIRTSSDFHGWIPSRVLCRSVPKKPTPQKHR
jgi:hypothetical protein